MSDTRYAIAADCGLNLAIASAALAQTYTMKTFAGGALPENVPGASANLGAVYGIVLDNLGNVFLALGDYHIVVRVDANTGVVTRVAGTGTAGYNGDNIPATSAQLSGPTGLAVDAAGNLYIADAGNFRVRMVSGGVITTIAGNGTPGYTDGPAANAQFNGLADLAIDSSANLYIADFYNQAIRLVSHGVITTVAGNGTYGIGGDNLPATSVPLAGPSGIALDSAGNLYIAEAYNNKIRKVVQRHDRHRGGHRRRGIYRRHETGHPRHLAAAHRCRRGFRRQPVYRGLRQ